MPALRCEALLLRSVDFGESDRIVHLLTADGGRLTAIAKAARRSHRRFPGTLDLFNHLAIDGRVKPRATMAFLERAKLVHPFLGLRTDPARYALASFLTEMLDRLSPEGIVGPEAERIFEFAIESLRLLERTRPTPSLRLLLELRGLDALGLRPEFGRCVRCGRVAGEGIARDHRVHFHVADGGIVCTACGVRLEGLIPIEIGTLRSLKAGLASPADRLDRIALGARMLAQAARVVFRFQRYHVGVELRSERFLDEMLPVVGHESTAPPA
ncbi:MAG: DNA repair protein RecO [bacterium]|nr:DNA repair protein RecO [bacterium]